MFSPSSSSLSSRFAAAISAAGAVLAALAAAGCVSVRTTNSLGRQPVSADSAGGPYFVISVDGIKNFDPIPFNRILHARYPSLFAQTPDSVPIMARIGQGATKSSDMLPVLLFGWMPMIYSAGLVGSIWDSDWSRLNVSVLVSNGDEPSSEVEVRASRQMQGLLFAPVANLFQPASEGWHRPRGDFAAEEAEALVAAIADALAATLEGMPPERRTALRRNPVALQRFQKKFPWGFGAREYGIAKRIVHVYPADEGPARFPRVTERVFNAATRRGRIAADFTGCEYAAAQRWVVRNAIPDLCREELGRDVSLVSISDETMGDDLIFSISFTVVE